MGIDRQLLSVSTIAAEDGLLHWTGHTFLPFTSKSAGKLYSGNVVPDDTTNSLNFDGLFRSTVGNFSTIQAAFGEFNIISIDVPETLNTASNLGYDTDTNTFVLKDDIGAGNGIDYDSINRLFNLCGDLSSDISLNGNSQYNFIFDLVHEFTIHSYSGGKDATFNLYGASPIINVDTSVIIQNTGNNNSIIENPTTGLFYINIEDSDADNWIPTALWTKNKIDAAWLDATRDLTVHTLTCTEVTMTSDERLKTNIRNQNTSLYKIQQLNPVIFNWIDSDKTIDVNGLIAQEVLKIIPEIVKTNSSGRLSIDYNQLISIIIKAIQELSNK